MKKLCLFVLITLVAFPVLAQSQKGYVYLKNGTILKGKFQYSDNLEKLKIESAGNTWVYNATEVDSIVGIGNYRIKTLAENKSNSSVFIHTEIGLLIGNSENSQSAPFSFTSSVNYSIDPNFSIGAGIGIEFLKESYLPVFINLEYKFRDSPSTPYLFLKSGYQIPLEESRDIYYNGYQPWSSSIWPGPDYSQELMDTKGGILINPGVGYLRMFSNEFGMSFAFGYQFHRLKYRGENDYELDIDYNRLTIKLGIIF
jgi:hypothetical protein